MWTTYLWLQAVNRSNLREQCTLRHQPTRHLRNARLRWLPILGPFEMPLIPPTNTWQRMPARLGVDAQPSVRSVRPAQSSAVCPSRLASGGRASHAARDAGQGRARAEQRCWGLPAPCRWEQGSRPEPCRAVRWAALAGAVLQQSHPSSARPRPGPSRAAALAGEGGDVSPAPVPPLPPPGAARSNSHGNPGSTPFPNPASAPRPAAPARRPPRVGNSPCVNSTCPERCAPLPASLRARPRGAPAESDAGPFLQRGGVRWAAGRGAAGRAGGGGRRLAALAAAAAPGLAGQGGRGGTGSQPQPFGAERGPGWAGAPAARGAGEAAPAAALRVHREVHRAPLQRQATHGHGPPAAEGEPPPPRSPAPPCALVPRGPSRAVRPALRCRGRGAPARNRLSGAAAPAGHGPAALPEQLLQGWVSARLAPHTPSA